MIWDWDRDCITALIVQVIQLQYYPQLWRYAKEVLLEKLNKRDYTLVKSYWVIIILNCLGKAIEKLVAEQLSQFCEENKKLHKKQMEAKKQQSAINAAAITIHKVNEYWENQQIV